MRAEMAVRSSTVAVSVAFPLYCTEVFPLPVITNEPTTMPDVPDWVDAGRGHTPDLKWTFKADGPLTSMRLTRETSELHLTDEIGGIYRLSSTGKMTQMTRFPQKIRLLTWSDNGAYGAGIVGGNVLIRFDRQFTAIWEVELSVDCEAIAIDAYGQFTAVAFKDSGNLVLDPYHQKVGIFQTMRPVKYMEFIQDEPAIVVAAEHGMIACFDLVGKSIWDEKLWSNAGDLSLAQISHQIWLAGYMHGLQIFGFHGETEGSYLIEGNASKVSVSARGDKIATFTIEQNMLWMDKDSEIIWSTHVPFNIAYLQADPLGRELILADPEGKVYCLAWG